MEKPEVFKFHDYRQYLEAMIVFKKDSDRHFRKKQLAKDLSITPSYLTMILNGKRDLTINLVNDLAQNLQLTAQEENFLELLVQFNNSDGDLSKSKFLERMKKFKRYQELNPEELKIHEYMSNWLNVVIREMTALDEFNDNPGWIKERIKFPTTTEDVKKSLAFLKKNQIIKKNKNGSYAKPAYQISCMDQVFSNALISFHRSFLKLAGDSTRYAKTEERKLLGHCVALEEKNIVKAQEIIQNAYDQIQALQKVTDKGEVVYFMELAVFPITEGETNV